MMKTSNRNVPTNEKISAISQEKNAKFFYNKMVTFPQNANVTASKLFKSNGGKKYEEKNS